MFVILVTSLARSSYMYCVGLHWNKWQDEMEKTQYWKKCSLTLIFNSKQVHEQQCLKACRMLSWCSDSIVLPSWWVAPLISTHLLTYICPVNVLYFLKFCPVFCPVSTIITKATAAAMMCKLHCKLHTTRELVRDFLNQC